MSRYERYISFACLMLWVLATTACIRDVDSARFADEPAIRLLSVSSTELNAFTDTLFVRFRYEDGNGDLGGFDGLSNLYVLDQRLADPDVFALETLTPNGEDLSITGEMLVALGPYFKLGNSPEEVFAVELWIVDRAGNESNHIITDDLTIR